MKKIVLIAMITLLGYAKGYSQLMQSNSMVQAPKRVYTESVQHLNKIVVRSDSLIKDLPLKMDTVFLRRLNYVKTLSEKLSKTNTQIDLLALERANSTKDLQPQINALVKERDSLSNQLKASQQDTDKARAENFGLRGQIIELVINKYNLYITTVDTELNLYKKEIGKNRKKALSNFDAAISSSSLQNQHYVDSVSNIMNLNSYIIQTKLDGMLPQRDSINKYLQELKQLKTDLTKYKSLESDIYLKSAVMIDKLDALSKKFTEAKQPFIIAYNTYIDEINAQIDKLNVIADKIKKEAEAEATEAEKISALGGINKIFGDQGVLVPNISVIGQKKFSSDANSSFYGEVKLFIGGTDDDKKNTGVNKLFIADASTYGFMTDFSFGFIGANKTAKRDDLTKNYEQKLAINIGVYYLGKKLQPDTLTSFNTSLFHVKIGLQFIIFPHVLSAYLNTNQLLVTTNIKKFEQYYTDATRMRSFTSAGFQSYLNLNQKSDFHLFVDLGFVKVNNDVNSWLNSSDTVIPNIKLSLVKTFNW